MKNNWHNFSAIFLVLFIFSCVSSPDTRRFSTKELQIAESLIEANGQKLMIKKIVNYHDRYYSAVKSDLLDLHLAVISNLKNRDLTKARKLAQKNMRSDAALMDKVKAYAAKLENPNEDNSIIRFSFNRSPFILQKAASLLADDAYFNSIISGKIFDDFKWEKITFMGGVDNYDAKGTVAISALTASLIYLLDDAQLVKNLDNHHAIIYNESLGSILKDNPKLLAKLQKNYHLFLNNDIIAKIYEGYEFGGDKDLQTISNPQFVPYDCSTSIAMLLSIKQNQFATPHMASYYDEFFKENSVYWKFSDWKIRDEIIKKLQPIKFTEFSKIKPGTILIWRNLKTPKSLTDPRNYVGSEGHAAIALGISGDDFYYISFERNLEDANKSGVGIDIMSVKETSDLVTNGKLAFFTFVAK